MRQALELGSVFLEVLFPSSLLVFCGDDVDLLVAFVGVAHRCLTYTLSVVIVS
jgi:hypothetical protein